MQEIKSSAEKNIVAKSNDLVQASYAMTLNEQRLLLACISKIDSRNLLTNNDVFVLTLSEARELFYSDIEYYDNSYRDLKEASLRLFERKVKIKLDGNKVLLTRFVQSIKFDPDEARIEIRFATEIIPYLSQLREKYTQYRLQNVIGLTSNYSIRIYELLACWDGQNKNKKEILISDFKEMLGIENKYKHFGHLKKDVIEPSILKINKETDFTVKVIFKKIKRSYQIIKFDFSKKEDIAEKEHREKMERVLKRQKNHTAKEKREKEEENKKFNELAKKVEFPKDNTFIKIGNELAQIEGKAARIISGDSAGTYITYGYIVKAIINNRLVVIDKEDIK